MRVKGQRVLVATSVDSLSLFVTASWRAIAKDSEAMASEFDRKRSKGGEEASARRTKRARLDEERTSSEGELALHPNDEDLFSLALAGKGNFGCVLVA